MFNNWLRDGMHSTLTHQQAEVVNVNIALLMDHLVILAAGASVRSKIEYLFVSPIFI